ncbi:MAG: acyl-CoA reductase [Saprospiraceae bacterium]|nr:acyl-CoA reductase [Saprospiraceae bacterium]
MKSSELFVTLGKWLDSNQDEVLALSKRALAANPWFTIPNIKLALAGIQKEFLDSDNLEHWMSRYQLNSKNSRSVGLILAGNIPLVGFHDLLCTVIAGHRAIVKLSEKDDVLLPALMARMIDQFPEMQNKIYFTERLKHFDAVIATGSNQTAISFHKYFSDYPHIIRKNRNSIAVLTGHEEQEQMVQLGTDIFSFFGLGCRNISKIYVPRNYDFVPLLETLNTFKEVVDHSKYRNNYDYNLASVIINQQAYMSNDCLIFIESDLIPSRVAMLHYEYYDSLEALKDKLAGHLDEIQCVVSNIDFPALPNVRFGQTQFPALDDYADGVDTMKFLQSL